MKKTMMLFLLLILAGSFASAFGQSGGVCTNNSVLQCAGGWIGFDSVTPPIPIRDATTITYCAVALEGSHRTYTAQYGGGYNDFKTNPDGSLAWYSVQVPDQIITAVDTCYAPCITTTPIATSALMTYIGLTQCPALFDQIAPPVDTWTGTVQAPDGSITGAQPLFESGWVDPRIDCNSVSIAPLSLDVANVTICVADTYAAPGSIGTYMGAPTNPHHCALVVQTSGTAPPTCSCGYQAICNGGADGTGHWGCPPEFTNVVYVITGGGCDPDNICTCTYAVTDNYDCNIYIGSVYVLIGEDCPQLY
jgi:hypothetical protein